MTVVILGGNECMIRRYEELCASYRCKGKVYIEMERGVQNIGSPDLLVLFTSTMSHKMLRLATVLGKNKKIAIVHSQKSSVSALKGILERHAPQANNV